MALQVSGPISIQDIVDEFGGVAPHSLSEYYRGGPYVGANNTGVPTEGPIKLTDFYGSSGLTLDTKTLVSGERVTAPSGKIPGSTSRGFATVAVMGTGGAFGSLTTNTFRGSNVLGFFWTSSATTTLSFVVQGHHPADFFTSITLMNGSEQIGVALASLAYHIQEAGTPNRTRWQWPLIVGEGEIPFAIPYPGTFSMIIGY